MNTCTCTNPDWVVSILSHIQGSCLGCVTDTLDLTEPYLFQGGTLAGVCVIVELMYISYHELSVHGALFVNVMAKYCLSYNIQFTLFLCSSSLSTRGLADFLLVTLTFVGLAGGRGVWRRLHEPVHLADGQALHRKLLRLGAPGVRHEHQQVGPILLAEQVCQLR